ncbi:MAG: hypothetical protein MZV70_31710 [Desulfobacterales bacterium]|nr:hypothetical protein [Desulfobacterales bacterium]
MFSGLKDGKYEKDTWSYQTDADGVIKKDKTLKDPELCFPAFEETLFPLHAGNRFENYRNTQR